MASPLPEPFTLVDILGDGEILTCRAELRGEEVLVHVMPADKTARDRVMSRIARLPRNPHFLDRIEHQGHSLLVTRARPEFERFEAWLDEASPEGGSAPAAPPPQGEATRLVLSIREHVGAKKASSPPPPPEDVPATIQETAHAEPLPDTAIEEPALSSVEAEPDEPEPAPAGEAAGEVDLDDGGRAGGAAGDDDVADGDPQDAAPGGEPGEAETPAGGIPAGHGRGGETVLLDMSEGLQLPSVETEPDGPVTPAMTPGMIGVPAAWSAEVEEEPRTVEMQAMSEGGGAPSEDEGIEDGDEDRVPTADPRPSSAEPVAGRATTAQPVPSPFTDDRTRPAQPSPVTSADAPTREPRPAPDLAGAAPTRDPRPASPAATDAATRDPRPAPPPPAPEEERGTRRRTQLFLSMAPPGGGAPSPPPPPPRPREAAGHQASDATASSSAVREPATPERRSPAASRDPQPPRSSGSWPMPLQLGLLAAAAVVVLVALAVWVL